jgi:hypothetical protein
MKIYKISKKKTKEKTELKIFKCVFELEYEFFFPKNDRNGASFPWPHNTPQLEFLSKVMAV